jgi:hypothetical protein
LDGWLEKLQTFVENGLLEAEAGVYFVVLHCL